MKKKRKNTCPSPLFDESPKRTKVHAQRKFAQGSNVNSPVITPIRELESESSRSDVLPEPVELLPIKRPNTEDFLTFLCFRGTPILPPSLNFFNTASIVDTNGQVHEIKSESSQKNGPIDITKCGTSSDKPFIAFGVRKRADPIVISRQMDRKRRHALAIQALRRKYQEQKMAKIRAITISKLSEKVTNRTLVKTNTVSKTETVTKKTNSLQKTKVVATKHVKVTTQTLKTTMRPKIKDNMCLRSFRGHIVQKDVPFIKHGGVKKVVRKNIDKKGKPTKTKEVISGKEEGPARTKQQPNSKNSKKESVKDASPRVTRSTLVDNKADIRRKQIKKRILRLTTVKKTVVSQRKSRSMNAKKMLKTVKKQSNTENTPDKVEDKDVAKTVEGKIFAKKPQIHPRKCTRRVEENDTTQVDKKTNNKTSERKKDNENTVAIKRDSNKVPYHRTQSKELFKKHVNKKVDMRKEINKSTDAKKDLKKIVEKKKSIRISNIIQKKNTMNTNEDDKSSFEESKIKARIYDGKKNVRSKKTRIKSDDPEENKVTPKATNETEEIVEIESSLEIKNIKDNLEEGDGSSKTITAISLKTEDEDTSKQGLKNIKNIKEIGEELLSSKSDVINNKSIKDEPVSESKIERQMNIDIMVVDSEEIAESMNNSDTDDDPKYKSDFKYKSAENKNFDKKMTEKSKPASKKLKNFKEMVEAILESHDQEGSKDKTRNKTAGERVKTGYIEECHTSRITGNVTDDCGMPEVCLENIFRTSKESHENVEGIEVDPDLKIFSTHEKLIIQPELKNEPVKRSDSMKNESTNNDTQNKPEIHESEKGSLVKEITKEEKQTSPGSQQGKQDINIKEKDINEMKNLTKLSSKRKARTKPFRKESTEEIEELNNITDKMRKLDTKTTEPIILTNDAIPGKKQLCEKVKISGNKIQVDQLKKEFVTSKDIAFIQIAKDSPVSVKKANIFKIQDIQMEIIDKSKTKIYEYTIQNPKKQNTDEMKKFSEVRTKYTETKIGKDKQDLYPNMKNLEIGQIMKQSDETDQEIENARRQNEKKILAKPNIFKIQDIQMIEKSETMINENANQNTKKQNLEELCKLDEVSGIHTEMKIIKDIQQPCEADEEIENCNRQHEKTIVSEQRAHNANEKKDEADEKDLKKCTMTGKYVSEQKQDSDSSEKLLIAKKLKKEVQKKDEVAPNKEKFADKKLLFDKDEQSMPKTSQRPSRKSKEAAAIYMEILSHKLVQESCIDDDNISIDSFPELPNVKKTEQRENELKKAQAKTTKDGKPCEKSVVNDIKESSLDMMDDEDIPDDIKLNDLKHRLQSTMMKLKEPVAPRRKSNSKTKIEDQEFSDSDEIDIKTLISRMSEDKIEECVKELKREEDKVLPKRQSRNIPQNYRNEDSYDTDESFFIEVKVPRQKKFTRSKTANKSTKSSIKDEVQEKSNTSIKPVSSKAKLSTTDDESTTSDINLQALANKAKSKKFSKTKSVKKTEQDFSDSDEEPLSKLTIRSIGGSQKSVVPIEKSKDEPRKAVRQSPKAPNEEPSKPEAKPKRECAKIPQNYLPMFSSSDEDDIFHGFDEKTERTKPLLNLDLSCSHTPPLLDLLNKGLSRRFGKEKVNMSNEQIEKWLKDSALAGSSIRKENDDMLKFGETIADKTSKTQKPITKVETAEIICKQTSPESTLTKSDSSRVCYASKPQIDRKLIFRKEKKEATPKINAFSPENESSVYAFGEENEDVISTPFRRPSRRPSSTATSRSEDESSKFDDSSKIGHFRKPTSKQEASKIGKEESDATIETEENTFYIPQQPTKHCLSKFQNKPLLKISKSNEKLSDSDDFKYKIPSSPSASSSSSTKLYKRQNKQKPKLVENTISPVYVSDFPKKNDPACLVEAPIFHPTEQEFQDPLEYIERIRHKAEQFGICRIVPPSTFKPECKVTDDMRFTAYNQYVHKMLHRWGPNFKELMAIKKYLETQNINLVHPPWIGGMEIDLPKLYQTVQTLGGLKEVIEKKKWPRVSELMKIPKSAQDRVTKLDDIYCKYLLPYDTLSIAEREKLFDEVETEWAKRESKNLMKLQQNSPNPENTDNDSDFEDDADECITKGRNMALNAFYRIARNTMSMYFKTNEPSAQEVEQEYWKYVTMRQNHICVNSGSIDSGNWGYGFAVSKNSPFARHPWNLKVLTNNSGSLLRSLAPLMAVTVPTLHVGMVFSACCWYRDPHGLPWIEYLHTGGTKIWYSVPDSASEAFRLAFQQVAPHRCAAKPLWLPSDAVMAPPGLLVAQGVPLCRAAQEPGQFVVVFPQAFTSALSTAYTVSESVYFAPAHWLKTAGGLFERLRESREPSMFSLDRLLISVVNDSRCTAEMLRQVMPYLQELCDREAERRGKLAALGEIPREQLPLPEVGRSRKKKTLAGDEGDYECDICRMSLFVSMIFDTVEGINYCLDHGIEMLEAKKSQLPNCKFMFTYDDAELADLPNKVRATIENKGQKKVPNKYAGMPTLLTK